MARQCPRSHDVTKSGEGADDSSARHITHQHQISPRGKAKQLEEKLEVAMAETLGAGGGGAKSTGNQSTRSHGQAGAPLRDLSNVPHLDG
jgi:hypothetical protein